MLHIKWASVSWIPLLLKLQRQQFLLNSNIKKSILSHILRILDIPFASKDRSWRRLLGIEVSHAWYTWNPTGGLLQLWRILGTIFWGSDVPSFINQCMCTLRFLSYQQFLPWITQGDTWRRLRGSCPLSLTATIWKLAHSALAHAQTC